MPIFNNFGITNVYFSKGKTKSVHFFCVDNCVVFIDTLNVVAIPHAPTLLENAVYKEWQFQALVTGNRNLIFFRTERQKIFRDGIFSLDPRKKRGLGTRNHTFFLA